MQKAQFPIFKTKLTTSKTFNLSDPEERKAYFFLQAGPEIIKLKDYLKHNTFIAYLLGKKNSGKGTYTKLFMEVVGNQNIIHLSIGDIVRKIHQEVLNEKTKKNELLTWLSQNYRGFLSADKALKALLNRSTSKLIPTEFILALAKKEISKMEKKTLFIDGFPRNLDQISYSLFFRDLIDYREDPDIFILIDVPESVIDERIKWRVACPRCHTPASLKLWPTKNVGYDQKSKQFYLMCDNSSCQKSRMIAKEGDSLGIEEVRKRLEMDQKLIQKAFNLHGVPRVLLRNCLPIKVAKDYVNDYEITPAYSYRWNQKEKRVEIIEKPWMVMDDQGILSYSLLPPAVVLSMIKQIVEVLKL